MKDLGGGGGGGGGGGWGMLNNPLLAWDQTNERILLGV